MKFIYCITLLSITLTGSAQSFETKNPDSLKLSTKDVVNFWSAYDRLAEAASTADSLEIIEQDYLQRGSRGLKLYQKMSSSNAESYLTAIRNHPKLLQSIRSTSVAISTYKLSIMAGAKKLKQIYPASVFPELFFCMGKFEVAGNRTDDVLYIGVELTTLTKDSPRTEMQNPYVRASALTFDKLDVVCLHEIAHYQQKLNPKTNLEAAMVEGGAEFVAHYTDSKS